MAHEPRLRVLCYNIRHGQGVGGLISTARIARVVASSGCDVAILTEVWQAKQFDQPALLGTLTGMRPLFHPLQGGWGRTIGNLVLSRLPCGDVDFIDLGGRRERRGCIVARCDAGGVPIALAGVHLSLHRPTRNAQLQLLASELPRDVPLLIAGDFNCSVTELGPLREVARFSEDVPATYPSPMPFRALDHVGYSRHWQMESLATKRSWASDHLPLVAELSLSQA